MDALPDDYAQVLVAKDQIIEEKNRENEELKKLIAQLKRDNNEVNEENEKLKREKEEKSSQLLQAKLEHHTSSITCCGDSGVADDGEHTNQTDFDTIIRRSRRKRRPKKLSSDVTYSTVTSQQQSQANRGYDVIRIPGKRGRPRIIKREPVFETEVNADNQLVLANCFDDIINAQIDAPNELITAIKDDVEIHTTDSTSTVTVTTSKTIARRKFAHHCDWPGCERSFRRPAFLRKHKRVHTGEKPFRCNFEDCEFASADVFCLRTHQMRHTGEKPFKCKITGCGWSGRQQTSYDRHRRVIHGNQRTFHCDWPGCDRKYRDKHSLNYHRKSHTGEKDFMCSFMGCGKRFIGRSDMKKHESTHNAVKPYKCSWPGCGRSFVQKRYLALHNLKHTGERPFPCDWPGCEWRSFTPHEQAKHKKTHTGERPFPCERCERRFADESNLKAHLRTVHEGQKNHVCDFAGCGKKYTVRRTLLIHRLKAHPNTISASIVIV